jgi:CDP-glucose 4,6-dehydratase
VVDLARKAYGSGQVRYGSADVGPHEAQWLALEIAKARHVLDVEPRWSLEETVRSTMAWYRDLGKGADARTLCVTEISAFGGGQA